MLDAEVSAHPINLMSQRYKCFVRMYHAESISYITFFKAGH